MYRGPRSLPVRTGRPRAGALPVLALLLAPEFLVRLRATSDLNQTMPLVVTLLAISVAGALITYAILAYALFRFRDPQTKGRRYG